MWHVLAIVTLESDDAFVFGTDGTNKTVSRCNAAVVPFAKPFDSVDSADNVSVRLLFQAHNTVSVVDFNPHPLRIWTRNTNVEIQAQHDRQPFKSPI